MARTAAIVGTASATRHAVDRRNASRDAQAYSNAVASTQPPPQQQVVYAAPPPQQVVYAAPPEEYAPEPAAPPPPSTDDMLAQLERLGNLKAQGILTEEEFQVQKAKVLAAG